MTTRFMSPSDFRAALALLHERGISMNKQLHQIFECGSNQPGRWAKSGAPRYVALALAAVLQELPPWAPGGPAFENLQGSAEGHRANATDAGERLVASRRGVAARRVMRFRS